MSVDQKSDEATSLAGSHVPKTPVEQDESLNTENASLSSGTLHLEDEPVVESEGSTGNSGTTAVEAPADESNGGILNWLNGLTVDEQAAAMGFADGPFLSAFMAVVRSTSEPETSTEVANEGECRTCTFDSILMISCVCWVLFERQFKDADTTLNFEFEDPLCVHVLTLASPLLQADLWTGNRKF
jgi:hypothetical protein